MSDRDPDAMTISELVTHLKARDPQDQSGLIGWCEEYNGPGYYNRSNREVSDARTVYNRLMNISSLIRLAEFSGLTEAMIAAGDQAAKEARPNVAAQAAAFRRRVPWQMLETRLRQRT